MHFVMDTLKKNLGIFRNEKKKKNDTVHLRT